MLPQLGLFFFYTDESAPLVPLAQMAESAGIESIWVPEHSHIPADPSISMPLGGPLPRPYPRLLDPFIVLTAIATVTSRVKLGTGVCLPANHHPIHLAKTCASLDRLSEGRLILGVGAGWIRGEIENHDVDFDRRWARALENISAMREIWANDEATFRGEWASFGPIWSWPKPAARRIPILLGTMAPSALVAKHADGWLPLSVAHPDALPAAIELLKARQLDAGRPLGELDITVMCLEPTSADRVRELGENGATRVVLRPPHIRSVKQVADFVAEYAEFLRPADLAVTT